ncbi:MAG: HPr kinase/phosphorylase [Treponema sp.]|nr:HPr kinase/phosphorylase [Treponema sp.]
MAEKAFTVLDLLDMELSGLDNLLLKCICGRKGLSRPILTPNVAYLGLALTGFFELFDYKRVQIVGSNAAAYLEKLFREKRTDSLTEFFSYQIPCVVFTHGLVPTKDFLRLAEEAGCVVLGTELETSDFSTRLLRVFSRVFAQKKTMHGVLVEVYGIGVLLIGSSGVGKSECALELVERGHRLVADDIVEVRCVNENSIIGRGANSLISHHMEIRGLGIINVSQLYGVGAVMEQKEIQLVIRLEDWNRDKVYDRVGIEQKMEDFFGVKIPSIEIPVRPGRNLPIIIEAAAMNERLKYMGYNPARDFNQNVLKWIETGEAQAAYYGSDDSY